MPGALTTIPIWGFASDANSPATAPGPVLVVRQGDQVTINLHNGLTQPMSLALPGQRGVNGGAGDDLTGVGPNGVQSYAFTASRPGTFVYEAGHTADGARQVAMGLAGALVVLPSVAGTAYGNPAGYPDTSYADDAVLVLSEIDPALNKSADPATFDMRNYRPAYRLINGHPYPSATSSIPTDQGHTVLLRYVNVGQQMHSMSILGGSQQEVAQDGHPMQYASTLTAESIVPGQTIDTLVTMPSSNGDPRVATKVAIYEANGALDNAGGLTADNPAQVGFGGMLAFLDTNAPVDTTHDYTGPTSKGLAVSPNPSDALGDVTVSATLSDAAAGGSTIKAAEYVLDDDAAAPIAPSSGTPMSLTTPGAVTTTATGDIPASLLADATFSAGKHIVYVRAEDSANNWGVVGSIVLNVPKTGPATTGGTLSPSITNGSEPIDLSATGDDSLAGGKITAAEYFLDTPPTTADYGQGVAMTINRAASVVSVDATFDPTLPGAPVLIEGVHHFYVHVKDDLAGAGLWGPALDLPLTVDKTGPSTLGAAVSPPATNGIQADPSNPGYLQVTADIADQGALPNTLIDAEAFLNTVKANGTGLQLLPVDGKLDSATEKFYALIPLSQIRAYGNGPLHLYVHGQDAAGNWGDPTANAATLLVDKIAPKLTGLSGALGPIGQPGVALTSTLTELNTLSAAEVWTATKDPGVGKATPATLSVANGAVTVQATLPALAGNVVYNIRVRDQAGNWSNAVSTTVAVFRSYLESTSGWAKVTTSTDANPSAATTTGSALPSPDEPTSAHGLQVNIGTAIAARLGYLSDNTPAAAISYHTRFRFQASTLVIGNAANVLTIFDTRTANGANAGNEVFALQYRVSGGIAQVRPTIGSTVGAWVNVGNTAHTIGLDWVSGASAKLVLTVDGAATTVTGSSTAKIEAAQLGVVNATIVGSATGKAYYDSFFSVSSAVS
ncbi:MAG: hypothetical protein QOD87_1299 [Pseudonocardiales bacterium]|nr:hypothetical protein [Pseudonocardiales bacterium]